MVIHGLKDTVGPAKLIAPVTKLAIAGRWSPPGMLSYYNGGEGNIVILDNPTVFSNVYRKALEEHEEQVLI